jgi:biopolymer transport protein ExbD
MTQGGMIVRLIDVVMILLFGFICSSQLSEQSKITLPTTFELATSNPDPEIAEFVGILKDGTYLLSHEKLATRDLNRLARYLTQKKAELTDAGYTMRVRLRANFDTPIRYVMRAADLCDRLQILKSVEVRKGVSVTPVR